MKREVGDEEMKGTKRNKKEMKGEERRTRDEEKQGNIEREKHPLMFVEERRGCRNIRRTEKLTEDKLKIS